MNPNKVRVTDYLTKMGSRSCDVAASLRELQIKGKQNTGTACPIANLVKKLTDLPDVRVSSHFIDLDLDGPMVEDNWVRLPLPVKEFVREFDKGEYPDLLGEMP